MIDLSMDLYVYCGSSNSIVLHMLNDLFYYVMLHPLQDCKSGISHLPVVPVTLVGSSQSSSAPSSAKIDSPISVVQTSLTSSANEVDQNGQASEYEDANLQNGHQAFSHARPASNSIHHCAPQLAHEATGKLYEIICVRFIQAMRNDLE